MSPRPIHPAVKPALEFGPVVAFLLGYIWLKDSVFTFGNTDYEGFIVVTAAFVPLILLTTAILWRLTGKLSKIAIGWPKVSEATQISVDKKRQMNSFDRDRKAKNHAKRRVSIIQPKSVIGIAPSMAQAK